jgi:hypothetical protein
VPALFSPRLLAQALRRRFTPLGRYGRVALMTLRQAVEGVRVRTRGSLLLSGCQLQPCRDGVALGVVRCGREPVAGQAIDDPFQDTAVGLNQPT